MGCNCLSPVYRLFQLMEEIMAEKENKTIIFVETKKRCDDLTRRMRRDGWETDDGRSSSYSGTHMSRVFSNPATSSPLWFCFVFFRWPAMCIHGDKSQPERDWVLTGKNTYKTLTKHHYHFLPALCRNVLSHLNTCSSCLFRAMQRLLIRVLIIHSAWESCTSLCSLSVCANFPANNLFNHAEFRSGKAPILIATDVASRGLGMSHHLYS